ncbi:MAG: PEP-CTERM sorting domain-containing protein [Actinomycetota bacterium]
MRLSSAVATVSLVAMGAVLSSLASVETAQAAVLGFDDLSRPTFGGSVVPQGYGGLNWNNFYYIQDMSTSFSNSGYQNGAVSQPKVAFNGFGNPASISSNTPFNFDSAFLTAALDDRLSITVAGLLGGVEKFSQTVTANTQNPTFAKFNYTGIDQLNFTSFNSTTGVSGDTKQFAIDNITYEPVPEPTTIIGSLLGVGILGAGRKWQQRKRQEKAQA